MTGLREDMALALGGTRLTLHPAQASLDLADAAIAVFRAYLARPEVVRKARLAHIIYNHYGLDVSISVALAAILEDGP